VQVAGVGDRALPFERLGSVQLGEQQLVQLLPDARLFPGAQPAPRSHPAAEAKLLRQVLPAASSVQHEQDPLQHAAVVERLATRIAEAPLLLPQQRLNPLPQPVPRFDSPPRCASSPNATSSKHD
jgi:hypothetical protein